MLERRGVKDPPLNGGAGGETALERAWDAWDRRAPVQCPSWVWHAQQAMERVWFVVNGFYSANTTSHMLGYSTWPRVEP
jgi:hypothetical protein